MTTALCGQVIASDPPSALPTDAQTASFLETTTKRV
jgi:hypothetical protein